ncbi:NTP pyrophosphohydrolase [Microbacterium nymphoidis]|jgi:hypothetical protein|uniref:NTP pyrophosphohydrolase n=1 Tax=Microbacterium nymphoidis TaxID=2898586 RepID=UPI001E5680D9|nr:NTP pyrophosphohydrolase [Microbacterium nymphoidis]MCD2499110.1 NTP pyrophosphohydrolase [Microbacterium nymphoidis]
MSIATAESATTTPVTPVRGVVRVHERAIEKVVREASAAVVGVQRTQVQVEVSDAADGITVRLATKLPVADPLDEEALRSLVPVGERVRSIQRELAERLGVLTGRDIRRITVVITGARVQQRRRVR